MLSLKLIQSRVEVVDIEFLDFKSLFMRRQLFYGLLFTSTQTFLFAHLRHLFRPVYSLKHSQFGAFVCVADVALSVENFVGGRLFAIQFLFVSA